MSLDVPLIKNNPATAHAVSHLEEMLADMKQSNGSKNFGTGRIERLSKEQKKSIGERIKDMLPGKEGDAQ